MTMGLFYLMLSPLPDRYSLDSRLVKTKAKDPRLLGFWRRVLQMHLCLVYLFGGLAKLLGSGWWNGANLWRSLTRPPFNLISPDVLIRFKYPLPVLGISICLIETRLHGFHLDQEDPIRLAALHSGDACSHRTDDGHVSVSP